MQAARSAESNSRRIHTIDCLVHNLQVSWLPQPILLHNHIQLYLSSHKIKIATNETQTKHIVQIYLQEVEIRPTTTEAQTATSTI